MILITHFSPYGVQDFVKEDLPEGLKEKAQFMFANPDDRSNVGFLLDREAKDGENITVSGCGVGDKQGKAEVNWSKDVSEKYGTLYTSEKVYYNNVTIK